MTRLAIVCSAIGLVTGVTFVVHFLRNITLTYLFDHKKPIRVRGFCFLGFIICCCLLFLGGIWPSLFTLVGILVVPAPFLFLVGVFSPKFICRHQHLQFYLVLASVLSIVCVSAEVILLLS